MHKKAFLLLQIAFVAVICWRCGSGESKTGDQNGKTVITILAENSASIQAMAALKQQYEAEHPDITLEFKPNTFDDAFTKSNQDLANKTGLYDIIMQYNFSLSSFVRNNYVYTIDELAKYVPADSLTFEKDLYINNWKEVGYYYKDDKDTSKGVVKVAYPFSAHSMLLMYNKKMFEDPANKAAYRKQFNRDLEPPADWNELRDIAQFFTSDSKGTKGICVGGAAGGFLYYDFMNFVYGMNGEVLDKKIGWEGDKNTKVVFDSPASVAAMKLYTSLKPYNAGNFTSIDQYEPIRLMKEDKTAMAIVWSDLIYPAIKTETGFDPRFGFASIPGNKAIFVGGAYFISRYTKHPKEVFEYITWLMQDRTQVLLAEKGICPSSQKTYEHPAVKSLPYAAALQSSIQKGGVILEAGPDANMISEVITTYVQKAWEGSLSPEEAVRQAQKQIEAKRKEIFTALNNQ
ncbi:extracellular solute-binding protein [Terrimonas sp. NA20]|uniref:Extracellular solute-binding protein n=1 Tax=Terrimonas ginsenosidimutans TaxID=2908004 RepID=A0ABS9KK51_9BACT|nr:extracellular solute-binding protein [Terrimonas ginsenosidimutans]MCG2612701.1 extracellular solute-binding protein [Terrimonas ginsenosidimutans]